MSRIRIGIVGAGHLGTIHTRLIGKVKHAKLVAIAEPQPRAQQQVIEEYNCRVVSDFRKLEGQIDAVIIATPTTTHFDVAKFFLERGVHCLIEKPLTHSAEQAEELVRLAERHHAVVQVGHVERFNPALRKALEIVGQPKFIEASRQSGYTFRSTDIGVVHDLMIHDIDLAMMILGSEVIDSRSVGVSVFGQHEDIARTWLHFGCGAVVNLTASRCSFAAERTMKIFGTRGFAAIDFAASTLTAIRIPDWIRQREFDFASCDAGQSAFVREKLFTDVLPVVKIEVPAVNAIQMEQVDWIESIRSGTQPTVSAADGYLAVSVAQRILDQIAMHAWSAGTPSMTGPLAVPTRTLNGISGSLPAALAAVDLKAA